MKPILILLASLLVVVNVYGDRALTDKERSALIGEYRYEGDWRTPEALIKNIRLEVTLRVNRKGELVGDQKVSFEDFEDLDEEGKGSLVGFRRISAYDWEKNWKILTLDGSKCDTDHFCMVSRSKSDSGAPWRLWRFSKELGEFTAYATSKRGWPGLLLPTFTVVDSKTTKVWCATDVGVIKMLESSCRSRDGEGFSTKTQAQAEHLRLKNQSSTVATTTSNSSTQGWCANSVNVFGTTRAICEKTGSGKWFLTYSAAKAEHLRLKNQSSTVLTASSNSSEKVWCATRVGVWSGKRRSACGSAKVFYSENEAEAEHLRLKNQSSMVVTTTEVAESQPTKINQSALELEFWQTIKDSNDPDMFREYLRQFPSGTFEGIAKIKIQKLTGSTTSVAQASIPNLDYGNYHALVIGNNRYKHLKPLSTAVNDANAVASLLRSQYQFNVDVLINATRDETVSALSRLRKSITPQDNLLIYYAGHGWLDKEMDEGFWLPVDATDDDQVDWIANDTIMRSVRAMKAKHVMVVADSCFSGTLIRGIKIKERSPDYIKEISQKKARTALTSGGIEPVTDVGGGDHSIFAATFIRILSENDGVLDGHQLFTTLRKRVMMGADQTPEYGDIRKAGHDGGDFLFVRR